MDTRSDINKMGGRKIGARSPSAQEGLQIRFPNYEGPVHEGRSIAPDSEEGQRVIAEMQRKHPELF